MPDTKKAEAADTPKKQRVDKPTEATHTPKKQSAAKPAEESLRLGTLLDREQIPAVEASGFLAGSGLKPTDRLTRTAFVRRFNAWRNQPAGKEMR